MFINKLCFLALVLLPFISCFGQSGAEQFLLNRGSEKARVQDYHGAMEDFTKIIEINPKNESAFNNRGMIRLKMHDIKGALTDFVRSVEIQPQFGHAYYNKGMAELTLGLKESAYTDLNKAQQLGYEKAAEALQLVSYKP